MDGFYEPRKIPNPECEGKSGCGPWKKPMKANPNYKVNVKHIKSLTSKF